MRFEIHILNLIKNKNINCSIPWPFLKDCFRASFGGFEISWSASARPALSSPTVTGVHTLKSGLSTTSLQYFISRVVVCACTTSSSWAPPFLPSPSLSNSIYSLCVFFYFIRVFTSYCPCPETRRIVHGVNVSFIKAPILVGRKGNTPLVSWVSSMQVKQNCVYSFFSSETIKWMSNLTPTPTKALKTIQSAILGALC